ncbi:MAG: ribosome small subunit-dependent GTPase A, partial [Oscillospiraceae bacterium]|nr:ribosome small subunit-dependent GTPase A [Oscillospiraceae bacterium]
GLILKGVGGFYTVLSPDGPVVCRPRGRFRLEGVKPLPGDRVRCVRLPDGQGRIEGISPRRSVFTRPPVANVDTMVIIVSRAIPISDPFLIDRIAALAARRGLRVVVCVNKIDLVPASALYDTYHGAGYETLCVSALTGEGMPALRAALAVAGGVSAFVGNSGVGKSSLLNRLFSDFALPTSEVSVRGGRGRHTTRHVELLPVGEGAWVADTPGFSLFDMDRMETIPPEEVKELFPEFLPWGGACRFTGCLHLSETGCAIWAAQRRGEIAASRFESYKRLVESAQRAGYSHGVKK